jgi:hypothetical protein
MRNKPSAKDLLTLWVNEKIETLMDISNHMESIIELYKLNMDKPIAEPCMNSFIDDSGEEHKIAGPKEILEGLLEERDKDICNFFKKGSLDYFSIIFPSDSDYIIDCKVIKRDCEDLIKILRRCLSVNIIDFSVFANTINRAVNDLTRFYYISFGSFITENEKIREALKNFHDLRTGRSTKTKQGKRDKHKRLVKESAIKMANQLSLATVRSNISEAVFVRMIKDDLPKELDRKRNDGSKKPIMSNKKITTLLHELQAEGQIKFDPRKAKLGKM